MKAEGKKQKISDYIRTAFFILLGLMMIFPFVWMISTSFKTGREVISLSVFPKNPTFENYRSLFKDGLFPRWFLNSAVVCITVVFSVLFFDSLAGFTFANYNFRGKRLIFLLILSTMMIPTEMLVIPWYLISNKFQWVDTYWGVMFPGLMTGFGTFLMRSFFSEIPNEFFEAGRIDGLSEFGNFWQIGIPMVKSALSALAIFSIIGNWNAFLWPLIISNRAKMYTLPVGLSLFNGEYTTQWEIIMTGATISTLPVIALYLIFQKQIIAGIALTGVKG